MDKLSELLLKAKELVNNAKSEKEVEEARLNFLGKSGEVSKLLRGMKDIVPEERPAFGKKVNDIKNSIEALISDKKSAFTLSNAKKLLAKEKIDVTLPGRGVKNGALHPLTQAYLEIRDIFMNMGFDVFEGPEIEYEKYNFDMLNIPPDHPARDTQDTFYISDGILLRTQTSPVQIRTMLDNKPPIRMICPGRVYRSDDVDATHSPVFNQVEGLVVDKGISFANLKATIDLFLKELYGESTKTKFRPGFFPFTEPSAEVDATCTLCHGKGCSACRGAGIVEILGCGMVHPKVLENCGIDSSVYSGFAFGLGLDRIANIKYGITDIRLLYENDVRFLEQFK
ncbi:MAG: phenylalanine--tRNA ligase subunit alpha [Eubacteriales bacterium]